MSAKLMHAVQYKSYGGGPSGLKHVEIPIPSLKKDEVLLKTEAASLNPSDFKIQKGLVRPFIPRKLPHTPVHEHVSKPSSSYAAPISVTDVAGEIVEVGQGVKKFKVGDKVVALLSFGNGGGLAEFAVAKEKLVVARPPEVSAAEGAGLPMAGLTAHQALTKDAMIKLDGTGQLKNILITGAAGGVGLYAVQLAKLGNTHVTATCGARNIELVKSLGADEVLDYKTPEGASLKSPSGRKYDVVIHSASSAIPWSVFEANLSARGKVIDLTIGASNLFTFVLKKFTFSKKKLVLLAISAKAENLDCLVKLAKEGKLKTVIDSNYPLSKAEDAWAKRINTQCTGKIIVEP
ncbi:unnamed protein product [Prunus armeniaca]|uniref:Enoyl reductase (ER) domain-containing protein n=1 Tax=Prunus armeniaca TaxID=36596 RepID=A0A6J5VUD8_PRUAR|nr:unnamed protein product [Prunus armeniaca]CAB4321504.1 unnamed protein product [Prunus armeniaca]